MLKKKTAIYLLSALILLLLTVATSASTSTGRVDASAGNTEVKTVYIHSLHSAGGHLTLQADPIKWYEGVAADQAFAKDDPEGYAELGGAPDGYYIMNDDETLATYPVGNDAKVIMQIHDRSGKIEDLDINWNEEITLQDFVKEFAETDVIDLSQSPYHLTIQNGKVVTIVQQYTP